MAEHAVAARIRDFAAQELRKELPYLKTAAVKKILDQIISATHRGIEEQAPVMERSKAHIGLLSLPTELRNQIYELVLLSGTTPDAFSRQLVATNYPGKKPQPPSLPTLASVSRQIRREVLPIFLGCNTLYAELLVRSTKHLPSLQESQVWAWFDTISPESAAMIKKLRIDKAFYCPLADVHKDICELAGARPEELGSSIQPWVRVNKEVMKRALRLDRLGLSADAVELRLFLPFTFR